LPLAGVEGTAALEGEVWVVGKIHDRCCQDLIASSASQRPTVDAETDAIPLAAAWRASSGQVQRASGLPLARWRSHASALTSATARAANFRGKVACAYGAHWAIGPSSRTRNPAMHAAASGGRATQAGHVEKVISGA
jgi:hypothetical protein